MTKINRSKAPVFAIPEKLYPIEPVLFKSKLGFPIYTISAGTEPIVRLDFIFQAGTKYQKELFVAGCTNSLLIEGTHKRTGKEIAETVDFLGSYIYPFYDRDEAGITMYCLEKHLKKNLELVLEILQKPSFPTDEIKIFKAKKQQSLILDKQKPENVAREKFLQSLFGQTHPYGIHGRIEDLDKLDQKKLISFHQDFYSQENMKIILTSRNCSEHLPFLEEILSEWKSHFNPELIQKSVPTADNKNHQQHYIEVDQATQTTIRLGKIMPDRHHPDFPILSVINTILGGYFGSRLMQNIREDKGYTYGIGSGLISFKEQTILTISSSVTSEFYSDAIKECFLELKRLREELIPEEELKRVRNYLIGDLQRQLDGPFNIADTFKAMLFHGLDFADLDKIQKTLFELNAEDIKELAIKYLQEDDFLVIAAGPSK
ncbi:MAG: insulinase family protein [Bacteroidales bacterium]|nr:insulinase family protein [Bacteroidales bacterium]